MNYLKGIPLVCFLILLITGCSPKKEKVSEPVPVKKTISEYPAVILIKEDGHRFMAADLPAKSIMIFFSPTCDHCQRQAEQIQKNLKGFQGYNLYFISLDTYPLIHQFAKDYKIDSEPNIHFLQADANSVTVSLGYIRTPTILIFNQDRKLVKRFNNITDVNYLFKFL
jgi:thiol-disulfide isomerase/thioredoxin